jgi:hypothetical protein
MADNRSKNRKCNNCGKSVAAQDVAAIVFLPNHTQIEWCFDCWDYDERAVEQYRAAGDIRIHLKGNSNQ